MSSLPFSFAVVTDEIDNDLARAAAVARELNLAYIELNQVGEQNIVDLSANDVRAAQRIIGDFGLRVCVIATPCFKLVELDSARNHKASGFPPLVEHLEMLKRGVERAHEFKCNFVRVFSFRRTGMAGLGNPSPRPPQGGVIPDDDLQKIAEGLRLAGDLVMRTNLTLVVENVRSCWGNTGENVARIVAAAGHPRVRILWDPGNAYVSGGVPMPDGYYAVRERMVHVHMKDARVRDPASGVTSWECVGAGEVGCAAQLQALVADGYRGLVTLETHWRGDGLTREQSTRESWRGLLAAGER